VASSRLRQRAGVQAVSLFHTWSQLADTFCCCGGHKAGSGRAASQPHSVTQRGVPGNAQALARTACYGHLSHDTSDVTD